MRALCLDDCLIRDGRLRACAVCDAESAKLGTLVRDVAVKRIRVREELFRMFESFAL